MKEEIAVLLMLLLVFAITIAASIGCSNLRCHKTAEAMGVECSYSAMTGCIINIKGKKIPLQNYRGFED